MSGGLMIETCSHTQYS